MHLCKNIGSLSRSVQLVQGHRTGLKHFPSSRSQPWRNQQRTGKQENLSRAESIWLRSDFMRVRHGTESGTAQTATAQQQSAKTDCAPTHHREHRGHQHESEFESRRAVGHHLPQVWSESVRTTRMRSRVLRSALHLQGVRTYRASAYCPEAETGAARESDQADTRTN